MMCSIEDDFPNKLDLLEPERVYNTLSFPLLLREQDSKFTDIENEFRLIAFDCPKIHNRIRTQINRDISINGDSGIKYKGVIYAGKDYKLKSSNCMLVNPDKSLSSVLKEENGKISIDSVFKPVNINSIASSYRFIGDKKACEEYILKMQNRIERDILVDKTVMRKYTWDEVKNAKFARSKKIVKY